MVDVVLAMGLAAFAVVDVIGGHDWPGPTVATVALAAVSGGMLMWRRSRPELAFAGSLAASGTVALSFGHFEAGSALLIGLLGAYSVAAYGRRLRYPVAMVVAYVVVFNVPHQPFDEAVGDSVFTVIMFGLAFGFGISMRTRHQRATLLEARTEELERTQEALAAAAVADERRRIARELHDIIAHSLGVVVLQAGAAEQVLEREPALAREALGTIRKVGQEAITEMGTLVGMMRDEAPLHAPLPSLADLDRLVVASRDAGLAVELSIEGGPRPLAPAVELSAFRVVQEGLTNARKHAAAARAHVTLRYRDHEVEVEVVDDGTGSGSGLGGRHGLAGVRERVAVFGGRFEAGPRPAGGWGLQASFPVSR